MVTQCYRCGLSVSIRFYWMGFRLYLPTYLPTYLIVICCCNISNLRLHVCRCHLHKDTQFTFCSTCFSYVSIVLSDVRLIMMLLLLHAAWRCCQSIVILNNATNRSLKCNCWFWKKIFCSMFSYCTPPNHLRFPYLCVCVCMCVPMTKIVKHFKMIATIGILVLCVCVLARH